MLWVFLGQVRLAINAVLVQRGWLVGINEGETFSTGLGRGKHT